MNVVKLIKNILLTINLYVYKKWIMWHFQSDVICLATRYLPEEEQRHVPDRDYFVSLIYNENPNIHEKCFLSHDKTDF